MKCQICDNPATVHLTDFVNKKKRELHLCTKCARERNLIPEPPGPQFYGLAWGIRNPPLRLGPARRRP